MVTRVIQGSSEDAVKLGDKFISEGMPNSLAWGLVCSLITGTKTDATAIRTVLSQQEEDYYAVLRAKRENKGSEAAAEVSKPAKATKPPKADPKPAETTAAPVTEPAPAASPAAPAVPKESETVAAPASPAPTEPSVAPATDHLDAGVETAPTTAGEGPKDPKPVPETSNSPIGNLGSNGEHL